MNIKKTKQNGFTLIELLVVIGVMGALLSFITVSFSNAQKQGRDSRRRQDLVSIQNALEQYYANNNFAYPVRVCVDSTSTSCFTPLNDVKYFAGGLAPVDPLNSGSYLYKYNSTATSYTVTVILEKDGSPVSVSNLQ